MAKNDTAAVAVDMTKFLTGLRDLLNDLLDGAPVVAAVVADADETPAALPAKPAKGKAAVKAAVVEDDDVDEDDVEDDEDDTDGVADRRAELTAMHLASLKKLAKSLGFPAEDVDGADRETLVESILEDEATGDDEEDEADDEDADDEADEDDEEEEDEDEGDDDDDAYTREDLEAMSLRELKALGKDAGYTTEELKGMDQDALVDFLLGEGDEEEDDAEDEEEEEYTEDDLKAMDFADLKELAAEWEVEVPKGTKKAGLIKALLAE